MLSSRETYILKYLYEIPYLWNLPQENQKVGWKKLDSVWIKENWL